MGSYEYNWLYFLQSAQFLFEICANLAQLWLGGVFNHGGPRSVKRMHRADQLTWWSGNICNAWKINPYNLCMGKSSQFGALFGHFRGIPELSKLEPRESLSANGCLSPVKSVNKPQIITTPFLKIKKTLNWTKQYNSSSSHQAFRACAYCWGEGMNIHFRSGLVQRECTPKIPKTHWFIICCTWLFPLFFQGIVGYCWSGL